jgi:pimeloyl-ACP methyl ester carboxylesterase
MAGRVHGRVAGGRVFILSDRDIRFDRLQPTAPEFQLAGDSERVALTCAALGVRADELDLPVPLDRQSYRAALALLESRGIVDGGRWLDGPDSEEGRVGGAVRNLFLEMNGTALYAPEPGRETNPAAFPAAYARLADLKLPAQVVWGDLDFPHIQQRCVHLVQAIPRALGTVIPGTAHLPNLEQPEAFNGHLKAFLDGF